MTGTQLQSLMKKMGLTQSELGERLNASQSSISNALKNRNDEIPLPLFRKLKSYLKLNLPELMYLLEGEMHPKGVPFYDIDAFATDSPSLEDIKAIEPSYFITIPFFKDCDLAVPVTGDSMYPKLCTGDIVVVKEIISRDFIVYGEMYLIISKTDNYRVIKYLHEHPDQPDKYLLVSNNEKFKPFSMPKDELLKLYLIKGRVNQLNL